MSYRELSMIDVKELLRRWSAGQSNRQIARETSTDRDTVARYVAVTAALGFERGREFTDEQVNQVAQGVQARPQRDASAEWQELAAHKERIAEWLARPRPLRLTKIHTLLSRDGLTASYHTLRRYAAEELGWGKPEPTILLEDPPPGQEAQVDFGKMGLIMDPECGRMRVLWVLIVTLAFSRYQFVWPTFLQTTASACEGLDHAWWFFGATIKTGDDHRKARRFDRRFCDRVLREIESGHRRARGGGVAALVHSDTVEHGGVVAAEESAEFGIAEVALGVVA